MTDSSLFDDPIFAEFHSEAKELLDRVRSACRSWDPKYTVSEESLNEVLRHLHTIKGNSAMFELSNTQAAAHELEAFLIPFKTPDRNLTLVDILHVQTEADRIDDLIENLDQTPTERAEAEAEAEADAEAEAEKESAPSGAIPETSPASGSSTVEEMIRVPLERVNDTLNYTWEIFLLRNQLSYLIENHYVSSNDANYEFLQKWEMIDSALRRNISELESTAMGMRMRTVSVIYDRVEKVSRNYLATSSKKVKIVRNGENVEVDKQVVDLLAEPMVHLIRNALDHGIELPAVRVAAGKPETGRISLATRIDGDQVEITISDDGGGIDADKVLAKARASGIDVSELTTTADVLSLIFHSGLSTAETVTNISGRGVGTDAVKTAVSEMGGTVRVLSKLGLGTTFVIRIPLSVSVLNALLFEANGALYACSISSVAEVCRAAKSELHVLADETFFDLRGTFVPCLDIRPALVGTIDDSDEHHHEVSLIIVARGDGFVALRVCKVVQHVELVLKSLPPLALNHSTVCGYSILHTGQPVFVLDLEELAQLAKPRRQLFRHEVAHAS